MSQHTSSQPRRRQRGGRNRRHDGDRDYTFSRPSASSQRAKNPDKPSFFQRLLGIFGLGKKPAAKTAAPAQSRAKSTPSRSGGESRPPREDKPARTPRPPIVHEVTSGRLYVGNLSYDVTESDLFDLFGGVGQVRNAEVVSHRHNHRSKGYAFVEMLSLEEAKRAVEVLNDKEFMGRKMLVSGAKSQGPVNGDSHESKPAEAAAPASENTGERAA